LIFAIINGDEELVKTLVCQGAFVNHQNHNGETALFWAAAQGLDGIAKYLIKYGSNVNTSNLDGTSPLHIAVANGHIQLIDTLVKRGAYLNIQDDSMDTPLHYAVREGKFEIIEFLISLPGIKVDVRNDDMESPLDLAQCLEPFCPESSYDRIIKSLSFLPPSPSLLSAFRGFNLGQALVH